MCGRVGGWAAGLVLGGLGQGETLLERQAFILLVRRAAGRQVPLVAQGVDTLPEVRAVLALPTAHCPAR